MNVAGGLLMINNQKRKECVARMLPSTTGSIQFVIPVIQQTAAAVNGATVVELQNSVHVLIASTTPKILNEYSKNQSNHRGPLGGIHLIPS